MAYIDPFIKKDRIMKLYYSKGACSLSIRILAHELGLTLEYESVDLRAKKTGTGADYWGINPKGSVPALLLEDGTLLTENIAIAQYLADTHPSSLLPPTGELERYRILEWQSFVASDLHKAFTPLFNPAVPKEINEAIFIPLLRNKLSVLEKALKGKQYLRGETLCLADPYCFVCLSWVDHFGISLNDTPEVHRYFETIKKRPAVLAALKEEGGSH
jgi:glutathione S-transferase